MIDPRVREAVAGCLSDIDPGETVVVGFSGGADSAALVRATVQAATKQSWLVVVAIIDHGLQPGSAEVAQTAAEVARALGATNIRIERVTVQGGGGLEAAARNARRAALEAIAVETNAVAILLAHTLDDQAETVLLGLARGSGARSLAGMRAVDGVYRRPLLAVERSVVRQCVADVATYEDPHNSDNQFARARVRADVLPLMESSLGPGVARALARSADMLRDDADALDEIARQAVTDDVSALIEMPRAIRTRVLRTLALKAGCPANDLTREHVLAVDALVTNWHGQGPINLPGAVDCSRQGGRLTLTRRREME